MPNGVPLLVYCPKDLIEHMERSVEEGKYVSKSDMTRAALRLLIGQSESQALREIREDRAKQDREYLKKAGGDRKKARELFWKDLQETNRIYGARFKDKSR